MITKKLILNEIEDFIDNRAEMFPNGVTRKQKQMWRDNVMEEIMNSLIQDTELLYGCCPAEVEMT